MAILRSSMDEGLDDEYAVSYLVSILRKTFVSISFYTSLYMYMCMYSTCTVHTQTEKGYTLLSLIIVPYFNYNITGAFEEYWGQA